MSSENIKFAKSVFKLSSNFDELLSDGNIKKTMLLEILNNMNDNIDKMASSKLKDICKKIK